jgi:hypothetical protein
MGMRSAPQDAADGLRRLEVIDGESAERLGVREHVMLLFMVLIRPVPGIDEPAAVNPSALGISR